MGVEATPAADGAGRPDAPAGRERALAIAPLRRLLIAATATVSLAGLIAELLRHGLDLDHPALSLWSLSYEGNLPSWYASALPLLCAGLLAWIAADKAQDRGLWRLLALGFLGISIDELISAHELLSIPFDTSGVLLYGWVIPAGILVLALAVVFLGFLRRLPRETGVRFAVAGAIYVTGAVVFELPLGAWADEHGSHNLGYALIDWCEETLEFVGVTLFAATLLGLLDGHALRLTRRGGAPTR